LSIQGQNTAPLSKILNVVNESIKEIEFNGELPQPATLTVTLKTESTKETGAGLKVLIFNFGKKWSNSKTNQIKYNFEIEQRGAGLDKQDMKIELSKVINEALRGYNNAKEQLKNSNINPKDFSIQIAFTIEKTNEAGLEFELSPITPNASKKWKKKAIHTIDITFK